MISDILRKNEFNFKKKFGQNFITDTNLLNNIIDLAGYDNNSYVVEVGPGAGTLTLNLAKRFKKILAYEVDTTLKPILDEVLKDYKNVDIKYGDILKVDIAQLEKEINDEYIMIANLPYYITTPIIFKFLTQSIKLKSIYIMVQKEVGERIVAKMNSQDYGILTVSIDCIANASITKHISRNMFYPKPNVDSCMVKIDIDKNKYQIGNLQKFYDLIKASFAMRRKTLSNNLSAFYKVSKESLLKVFKDADIKEDVRGEQLSTCQYVNLFNSLKQNKVIDF